MNEPVAWIMGLSALAVAGFAGWHTVRDRPFSNPLFYAMGVLELMLLVVLVGASVALAGTDRDVDGVLFVSYLVTVVVIPPAAVLWGIAEKSRWGTGVVLISLVTVAALSGRLHGIWEGTVV